jgi:hypothetical protein
VIPSMYLGYFQAASQAAAALLGLLFVVIVLRPGRIVGAHANPVAKGLAASTFTGLVDAFFISLLALIPGHKLGIGAAITRLPGHRPPLGACSHRTVISQLARARPPDRPHGSAAG